jgi:hypothetical protein
VRKGGLRVPFVNEVIVLKNDINQWKILGQ